MPRPASAGGGSRGGAGGAGRGAGSGRAGSGRCWFGRSRFGRAGRAAGLRRAAAALLLGVFLLPGGLLLAGPAEARTAISNRGQATGGATNGLAHPSLKHATHFTTGPQKGGYRLESVGFDIEAQSGPDARVRITIHENDSSRPGDQVAVLNTPSSIATGQATLFTAPAGTRLNADTTYYVVVSVTTQGSENGNALTLRRTDSDGEDSNGLPGWVIGNFDLRKFGSNTWASGDGYALKMHVNAAVRIPDPPPAGADAAVGNLDQGTRTDGAALAPPPQAQGFTTGANPDGYELKSVQLEIDRDFTGDTADIRVEIWTEASGAPGAEQFTLNKPGTIAAGTNSFTAPAGHFLDRNTTYYVVVSSSGGTLHLSKTADAGEDTASLQGWSIADDRRFQHTDGTGWGTWTAKLKMRVNAAPVPAPADAAVGNIAQATATNIATATSSERLAQAFATGAAGHGYILSAIQLQVASFTGSDTRFAAAIHADASGSPGAQLFALDPPDRMAVGVQTFTAPAGAALEAGRTYHAVVSTTRASVSLTLRRAAAGGEDTGGLAGWSIADNGRLSHGSSWTNIAGGPLKLRVRAHATPPPAPAGAGTAAGNLAQVPGAGAAVAGPGQVAQAFTTGPIAAGYELESVQVQFDSLSGGPQGIASVQVVPESSGNPHTDFDRTIHLTFSGTSQRAGTSTYRLARGASISKLQPNTTYYVMVKRGRLESVTAGTTASAAEDPGGLDAWSVADRRRSRAHSSAAWSTGSAEPLRIRINAREAPPPTAAEIAGTVAVSNLGTSALGSDIQRIPQSGNFTLQQGFRTGSHAAGYTLHGIDLDIYAIGAAASGLTVAIYTVTAGQAQTRIATLNNPAGLDAHKTFSFTAPAGTKLDADTTYIVAITKSGDPIDVETTDSTAEDGGGLSGWSISDAGLSSQTASHAASSLNVPLKLRVRATEATGIPAPPAAGPETVVGNLGRDRAAATGVSGDFTPQAQGFTTGPQEGGWDLKAVHIEFDRYTASDNTDVDVRILEADDSGEPVTGSTVATLTRPANILPGTNSFAAPAGTVLAENATYFVQVSPRNGNTSIKLSKTASNRENDGARPGWSLADGRRYGTGLAGQFSFALMMRIDATPPPPAPAPPASADAAVSNLGKRAVANVSASVGAGQRQAQAFTTGPQLGGYDLESVEVELESGGGTGLNAAIHAASGGNPGAKLFDLARAGDKRNGLQRFSAPAGATLDAETTYILAISGSGSALSRTALGTEDDGALPGWTIADSRRFYNGSVWSRGDHALKIRVNAVKPDIARLTGILVVEGGSDSRAGANLSPGFDPDTTDYTATVANDVRQVTLLVNKQAASQSLAYLDGGGEPLADAALADGSLSDNGILDTSQQVALGVGTTTVKVKVTAPGRTAATTYTLAIVRQALCSAASAQNRIWTGNLAVGEGQGVRGLLAGTYGSLDDTDFAYRGTARSIGSVVEGDNGSLAATISGGAPADLAGLVLHIGESRYPLADAARDGATFTWTGNAPGWAGGDAACLALTAPPDTTPPALLRAEVTDNGRNISLAFDEVLDGTSIPGASAFTVTAEGSTRAVDDVTLIPDDAGHFYGVRLEFSGSNAIRHGERVTVAYTKPTGDGAKPLKDLAGNEVESFADVAVANRLEAPEVVAPDASSFPVAVQNYGGDSDNTENLNGGGTESAGLHHGFEFERLLPARRDVSRCPPELKQFEGRPARGLRQQPGREAGGAEQPGEHRGRGEHLHRAGRGRAPASRHDLLRGVHPDQRPNRTAIHYVGRRGFGRAGRMEHRQPGERAEQQHRQLVRNHKVARSNSCRAEAPYPGGDAAGRGGIGAGQQPGAEREYFFLQFRHWRLCPGLHHGAEPGGLRPDRSQGEVQHRTGQQRYRDGDRYGRDGLQRGHPGDPERAGQLERDQHLHRAGRHEAGAEQDLLRAPGGDRGCFASARIERRGQRPRAGLEHCRHGTETKS